MNDDTEIYFTEGDKRYDISHTPDLWLGGRAYLHDHDDPYDIGFLAQTIQHGGRLTVRMGDWDMTSTDLRVLARWLDLQGRV